MRTTLTTLLAMPALLMAASIASDARADAKTRPAADKSRSGRLVQMHPLPQSVASNGTVTLHCGRHYYGTLNLDGRANVTVRTEGDCGKASITPARQVQGWNRQRGNIWIAPVDFEPVQVTLDGRPLALAHHPNKPWGKGTSTGPMRVQAAMPDHDLTGATIVYRPEEWMIETRRIADYDNGAIVLGPKVGDAIDPSPKMEFYVEGKLWMLDSPGEWAVHDGWLFIWTPDGNSPEGRVWVGPRANGINAERSRNVTIENVRVHTALTGISAGGASNLVISNVEIANSAKDGIFVGGRGVLIDGARISNSVQNGILGDYGIEDAAVINSQIVSTGTFGMPKRSKGGISFEQSNGTKIMNNRIIDSSYIAIRVHRKTVVSNNLIDGACLVLTDCGGIYTFARDRKPLDARIESNTVRNVGGRYGYGVYLDDSANGVTVSRNLLTDNAGGIEIHNGFDNVISQNVIADSQHEHMLFNETGSDRILRNRVYGNLFITGKDAPTYRLWSVRSGARSTAEFGEFDQNLYVGSDKNFAELQGVGMVGWSGWRSRTGQDGNSRQNGDLRSGRERIKRWRAGSSLERINP